MIPKEKDDSIVKSTQKCEHCSYWTDGKKSFCSECGEILDLAHRKERSDLEKKWQEWSAFMQYVKLKGSDKNMFLLFLEKCIQTGQFILTIIIVIVTLILFLIPG